MFVHCKVGLIHLNFVQKPGVFIKTDLWDKFRAKPGDYRWSYITGYSLGGGLAQFACEDAAWHFGLYNPQWDGAPKEIKSISYEGPRVFCQNGGVQALLSNKQVLIKTWWDTVTHLLFLGYELPGLR
jgi:hypothetical protein